MLVDTPGVGEHPQLDAKVKEYLPQCHSIIVVVDSSHGTMRNSVGFFIT